MKQQIKKMGKHVLTFSLLIGLFLTSCSNSRNNEKNQKEATVVRTEKISNEELLVGHWVERNPINEKEVQGIEILKGGNAKSINMQTLVYSKWWSKNNQLLLVVESIGNHSSNIDTVAFDIIKIDNDSLILKKGNYTLKYKKQ